MRNETERDSFSKSGVETKMVKDIRAAVLRNTGSSLQIENLTANPLTRGQVIVEIFYSGICRSQIMEQQGKRGEDKWLPHLLGHEGYGEVLEIGPEVSKCKVGDRVVLSWVQSDGINADSPSYHDINGEKINSGKVSTFSTISVVSENRLFLAPEGFNDRLLALFGCALLTGGGMALKYGKNLKKESICILGFGGIGSAAALVLKGMGKLNISVVEEVADKRELAHNLGFEKVFSTLTQSEGNFDLVIEATGTARGIEAGFENLNDKGVLVFASHPENGAKIALNPHDLIRGKRIYGTWGGDVNPDKDVKLIADFISATSADLELLLGQTFTLDEVNEGLAYLESGKPGRPLLRMNGV